MRARLGTSPIGQQATTKVVKIPDVQRETHQGATMRAYDDQSAACLVKIRLTIMAENIK